MGVASGFNRGSDVVGGAAADLQMAIEVGERPKLAGRALK